MAIRSGRGHALNMRAYQTIVVGTDFSAHAELGVSAACAVARWSGTSRLHLVHVVPVTAGYTTMGYVAPFPMPEPAIDSVFAEALADARRRMDSLVIGDCSATVTKETVLGMPVRELERAAKDVGADLMVIATHDRGGLARIMLGSVAEAVVRVAHCPVYVVGPTRPGDQPPKRVLAAVDLSPVSEKVLANAFAMAGPTRAKVVVLSLIEMPILQPTAAEALPAYLSPHDSARILEEHKRTVKALVDRVRPGGIEVEIEIDVRHARPVDAVTDVASEHGADLVVVGTSGHNAWKRLLLGATANKVVTHAKCPVLVVPYDAQEVPEMPTGEWSALMQGAGRTGGTP